MIIRKEKQAELVSLAVEAILAVGIVDQAGKVQKVHEGYINALGPAIIQSDLIPALIFYSKGGDGQGKTEGNPSLWLKALCYMHKPEERAGIGQKKVGHEFIAKLLGGRSGSLRDLSQEGQIKSLRRKVLQYVVALKLALRTFEIDDSGKKGGEE